jgi:molybdate transport system permease protein
LTASRWFTAAAAIALALAFSFFALPLAALFVDRSPGDLLSSLGDPVARDALLLSLQTTLAAIGTPAAWLLATRSFRGRSLVETLVELPLVLPPAVAGIALLASLGPNGILGGALEQAGVDLVFQTAGVVVALTFVSAPFFIRGAQAAFAALDPTLIEASRTLGASEGRTFLRVAVPAAAPGLAAGLALAWGRALGEFGATLFFAGSFQAVTQTAPLAIYAEYSSDFTAALALSVILVVVSFALLLTIKLLAGAAVPGRAER